MQAALLVVNQLTGLQRLEIIKATPNTMDVICQRIAGGETLKQIASCWEIPFGPFHIWIGGDDSRMKLYRNAQELLADSMLNEVVDIADGHEREVKRDRLRVQARIKVAEKLHPTQFGSRPERESKKDNFSREGIAALVNVISTAIAKKQRLPGSADNTAEDIDFTI